MNFSTFYGTLWVTDLNQKAIGGHSLFGGRMTHSMLPDDDQPCLSFCYSAINPGIDDHMSYSYMVQGPPTPQYTMMGPLHPPIPPYFNGHNSFLPGVSYLSLSVCFKAMHGICAGFLLASEIMI